MNLVEKGKRVPLKAVMQQGRVSETLAIKTATEIARGGFLAADLQLLSSKLAQLDTEAAEQSENRVQSRVNRAEEAKALADAKAFKRRLDTGVKDLSARAKYEPDFSMLVPREAFLVGTAGGLRNSTANYIEYLVRVRPSVEKMKTQLAPYFDGGDPVTQLDEVVSALKTADSAQEHDLQMLPQETLDVYQLKGEVLYLIERLNRAGRIAFDGDASMVALFNKDIILRARRGGAEAVDGEATVEAAS